MDLDAQIANRNRCGFKSQRFEIAERQRNRNQNRLYICGKDWYPSKAENRGEKMLGSEKVKLERNADKFGREFRA